MSEKPSACGVANVDLHVFSLASDSPQLEALLSPAEKERAGKFHFVRDRLRWIAARAGLRILLARHLTCSPMELVFLTEENGKPFLADAHSLHFNISHSQDAALLAITWAGPVGVDLEPLEPLARDAELATCIETFCSPAERQSFAEDKNSHRLLKCWCGKEAFLKALGTGLSTPPNLLTLEWDGNGASVQGNQNFRIHFPTEVPDYCAAVALPSHLACPKIGFFDLENSPV